MTFPARVAAKANELRPARVVLSVLAFPFYVVGLVVGVVWVAVAWAFAAVAVGVADVRARGRAAGDDDAR